MQGRRETALFPELTNARVDVRIMTVVHLAPFLQRSTIPDLTVQFSDAQQRV